MRFRISHNTGIFRILCSALLVLLLIPFVPANPYGTETLIPTNLSSNQQHAAIDGSRIVWDDPSSAAGDIFLYDISSGNVSRITSDVNTQKYPRISSDRIIWQDYRIRGSGDIYRFDLGTNLLTRVSGDDANTPEHAAVSGDRIVWQDRRNGDMDIYLHDLSSGTEYLITPDTAGTDQTYPAISGNRIVWEDSRNFTNGDREIFLNDTATWTESLITPDNGLGVGIDGSTDGAWQDAPSISGTTIVWEDNRNWNADPFPVPNIYWYDPVGGEQRISDNLPPFANLPAGYGTDPIMFPSVDGDRIVWIDYRNQIAGDIFLNDTARFPPEQLLLSSGSYAKTAPRISGSRIIWTEESAGNSQIHLFTYGTPQTCPEILFSGNATDGGTPLAIQFTDGTGVTRPSHWYWDFGDGTVSYQQNPDHVFGAAGQYLVNLTISDDYCRNISNDLVITAGSPAADFIASPVSGVVPLSVQFNDSSTGAPDTFAWDFENDGIVDSTDRNATHTYVVPGTYSVRLNATNMYGTGSRVRTSFITALPGAHATAFTPVSGIVIDGRYGGQFLTYTGSLAGVPSLPSSAILISHPPASYGWQNITFTAADSIGFSDAGNGTWFGNVSLSLLQTADIPARGFSPSIGDPVFLSNRLTFNRYPSSGSLNAEIWEGATPFDTSYLNSIAYSSGYTSVLTGYSARFVRNSLGTIGTGTMNMSISSAWVARTDGETFGRGNISIMTYGTDPATGATIGTVLPTRFSGSDGTLDYFEADIPAPYAFFSNFYVTKLTGPYNPLQLITLSVTSHVNPPPAENPQDEADGGMDAGKVITTSTTGPVPTPSPAITQATKAPGDPGISAKVYTNAQGIVTQATRLTSSDGRATITLPEGTTATDAAGKPLEKITIRALSPGELPPMPSGSVFIFDGIAYDVGPDGSTFSPPVSLSFTPLQIQGGREYSVQSFETGSGSWEALPTGSDGSTGTVTAQISHLCVHALFTRSPAESPPITASPVPPAPVRQEAKAQPPSTAVSIFTGMMGWIAGLLARNILAVVAIVFIVIAAFIVMRRRMPGS